MHYLLLLQLLNTYKAELVVLENELTSLQAQESSTIAVESVPMVATITAPVVNPPVLTAPQTVPQVVTQNESLGIATPLPQNPKLLKNEATGFTATTTIMQLVTLEPATVFTVNIQGPCELDYTGTSTDLGTFDPTQINGNEYALILDSSAVGIQQGHQYCYTIHIESADSEYDGTNFFVTPSSSTQ